VIGSVTSNVTFVVSVTGAVSQLLDSLEEIKVLTGAKNSETAFLQGFFEDPKLQALLEVCSHGRNGGK